MGYFSNGIEGEGYFETYCSRCIHVDGPDGKSGCAVWLAHLTNNYAECNKEDSILHILIPRKGLGNDKCRMFVHTSKVYHGTMPEHLKEWAKAHGIVEAIPEKKDQPCS